MPQMMSCPVCGSEMRSRNLLSQQSFKSRRLCPNCGAKYTTDASTKRRGLVIAAFALFTVALSVAGHQFGFPWGVASFVGAIGLLIYVGYALSKVEYVEFRD
jgi:RNA polymerase subunit RPABC4/transcription elongation factor Spt4